MSTTICPWCSRVFGSQPEWADHFDESHPVVAWLDSKIPILNTPSPESRFASKSGGGDGG